MYNWSFNNNESSFLEHKTITGIFNFFAIVQWSVARLPTVFNP